MTSDADQIVVEFRRDATRVAGVHPIAHSYFRPDGPVDAFTARRIAAEIDCLLGAVWNAAVILVDECFADLLELENGTDRDEAILFVLDDLPPAFQDRFDVMFSRRFLVSAATLTGRLTTDWDAPGCVAEELALRLLLNKVEASEELYELNFPTNWRRGLEDLLFQDLDHEFLYLGAPATDARELGLAPGRFDDWFQPFSEHAPRIPYVVDRGE